MKNSVLIIFLSLLPFFGSAQKGYKLLEQNPKEKPSWLTKGIHKGEFMVQAIKVPTLEEAKSAVMSSLLNDIASSISVVVMGETVDKIDWTAVELEGKTKEEYIQTIEKNTTIKIAKMPALQGVSLSKAEVYWEKYINKKTKEISYDYYVLYPFSDFDLQELIDAYNAQEKAINDKIDSFRTSLDEIDDIDVLLENISQIKSMKEEFKDDYSKCSRLESILSLYEKTIKDIYIEVVENYNDNDKGTLAIVLKHDEKIMKTKSLPQMKGACARDFSRKHDGSKILITFNTFDCYEQDDNYVEVRFTFGKRKLMKKILINL